MVLAAGNLAQKQGNCETVPHRRSSALESLISTRVIGWLSVALLGLVIALPFFGRSLAGTNKAAPGAKRMMFHYWLAPAVALGSFVHAWIPMASGHMPRTSFSGLWIATLALGMILLQLGVGLALRYAGKDSARLLIRIHLTVMFFISALVLIHLWMNSPLFANASPKLK